MKKPKISVILPFYNARDTLAPSIESIYQQTYPDWELLLIDNNSGDGSLSIAMAWQQKDNRIRIIAEKKQGIAHALNTGLQYANGPYIARMDADDRSIPDRLESQFHFLENRPVIGVVATQTDFRSSLTDNKGYRLFVEWQNNILSSRDHEMNRFVESPVAHPSVMFRKSCIDLYGGYDTGHIPEDYELWLRWMSKGVKFAKIPEKLLIWHDHAGRLSRNHVHYQTEAFDQVTCHYLARWVKQEVAIGKKIVVCGTGKRSRRRAGLLEAEGVHVYAFTNVVNKKIKGKEFVPVTEIKKGSPYFFVNFIAKRGVSHAIRQYFLSRGLEEGNDFIM